MLNHWHLVLRPAEDGQLGRVMQRLTVTHVRRWHEHRHSNGGGRLYQGTYKSFPVQHDPHLLCVNRYVERNALRAGLWWGGHRTGDGAACGGGCAVRWAGADERAPVLSGWPVDQPADWLRTVNEPQTAAEEQAVRCSIARSRPLGSDAWVGPTVAALGLEWTQRPRGGQTRRRPEIPTP